MYQVFKCGLMWPLAGIEIRGPGANHLSEPLSSLDPDSPDEMALGQLRAPISIGRSNSYAGSSSRILAEPTGERRSRRFRQNFRGLRSCRPNPSGESGLKPMIGNRNFKAVTDATLQLVLRMI